MLFCGTLINNGREILFEPSVKGIGFFVNEKDAGLQERFKMEYQAAIDQALED